MIYFGGGIFFRFMQLGHLMKRLLEIVWFTIGGPVSEKLTSMIFGELELRTIGQKAGEGGGGCNTYVVNVRLTSLGLQECVDW